MPTRSSDENSICPSARRVYCDKTEKKICADFYSIRKTVQPTFLRRRMVGGATPSTWNFGSSGPRWSEIADIEPIFARSASAVTSSEKSSINTNRKSTPRFPTSLRWSSYVAPTSPKEGSKMQNGQFRYKLSPLWRKSATKFLCVKTASDKVVRHSLA